MKRFICALLLICLVFVACDMGNGNNDNNTPIDPIDPAFWFGEVNEKLIERIGSISTDDYTGPTGDEVGQAANVQYVCNAINAKWGTTYSPVSGTATQAANVEYLLKMVDKANNNTTTYGTSSYATKQIVDVIAVNDAVNRLWVPGSKFVAVAGSNIAAYSTDGINWTETTMPDGGNAGWYDVCYGDGKFVAVAYYRDNKAAYSTDGINWNPTPLPSVSNGGWRSVCYGDGKFVAVTNYTNKAAYSTDGINWTETTLPEGGSAGWYDVCYGDDKFVAVAYGGYAAYSYDGINWTRRLLPNGAQWYSVAYGDGKFVAVGDDIAAYSTNGINWFEASIDVTGIINNSWQNLAYGGGKFVAVTNTTGKIIYSGNGGNWSEGIAPGSMSLHGVCYGNGKFVVMASSNKAIYSTNGIIWFETTMPSNGYSGIWYNVCYGGD